MKAAKILRVLDLLEGEYHNEARPPELGHAEPLDGLICTVLSQNTNDRNRDSAFANLKANFPVWADVVKAGPEKLEEVIRTAGLAHTKAQRIITILAKIHADFHEHQAACGTSSRRDCRLHASLAGSRSENRCVCPAVRPED